MLIAVRLLFLLFSSVGLTLAEGGETQQKAPTANSCDRAFHFIETYRQGRLWPLSPDVNPEVLGYRLIGNLGQSTSTAYLASHPASPTWVVIKISSRKPRLVLPTLWRELAVTEYLLESGETVPKILQVQLTDEGHMTLVKEYFAGLTGQELETERLFANPALPRTLSESAWNALEPERERLKALFAEGAPGHAAFRPWYMKNLDQLIQKYPHVWKTIQRFIGADPSLQVDFDRFVRSQDFGKQNFLYLTRDQKWVAFDP